MGDVIEAFLFAKELGKFGTGNPVSSNTVRAYRTALERAQEIADKPITAFTREDVAYVMEVGAERYTASTVNQMLSALRSVFGWLRSDGVIADDPTFGFSQMRKVRTPPVTLTAEEIESILEQIPMIAQERRQNMMQNVTGGDWEPPDVAEKYELFFRLMAVGGMRVSEVAKLRAGDIDLDGVIVHGRAGKERYIPIRKDIVDWVRKYAEGLDEDDFVFQGERGPEKLNMNTPMSLETLYKYFREAVERSGVKKRGEITPHTLRHSFATQALRKTGRLDVVQDLLGHANPQTTSIYAQIGQDDLKDQYDKIWA